jgi:ferredoxin
MLSSLNLEDIISNNLQLVGFLFLFLPILLGALIKKRNHQNSLELLNSVEANTTRPFPDVNTDLCKGCKLCVKKCENDVYQMAGKLAMIKSPHQCIQCSQCVEACPFFALSIDVNDYDQPKKVEKKRPRTNEVQL